MKKPLFALALCAAVSAPALAQQATYSHAVAVQKACNNIGELGQIAYRLRASGATDKQSYIDKLRVAQQGSRRGERVDAAEIASFEYGFDKAQDSKDAYMTGWAMCMDAAPK